MQSSDSQLIVKRFPIQVHHFVISALYVEPCDLSLKTSTCAIPNYLILCFIVGMVLSQTVLWMDRLAATISPLLYSKHVKMIGVVLSMTTVFLAFLVPFILLRGDPYNDYVLTCIMTPRRKCCSDKRSFLLVLLPEHCCCFRQCLPLLR
ncbi:hypothetical protein COOONC_09395 [Cooperia oncophora]